MANPMSITVARRIEIERAIVERLVSDALFFHGYTVSHSDGEALIVERSRDIGPIMAQLHSYDEESLTFHDADGHGLCLARGALDRNVSSLPRLAVAREPKNDVAVALARAAHGPHAVNHRRLDLDEALVPIALHGATVLTLGRRRGDGVVGQSSAAHSREVGPRWNFWSRGPFVVVRGGHRRCKHSGKLA
jgi:hypothetical protein